MRRTKLVIIIAAMCIHAYLQARISMNMDIINVYNGAIFSGTIVQYLYCFFLFSCYCLYMYNEFETYINQCGTYFVIREKSRDKLFFRLFKRLLKFVVLIECIKIVSFSIIMFLIKGSITLNNSIDFIIMFIINILFYIAVFLIQMLVEIYFSGNVALYMSLACYLIGLGLSDYISNSKYLSQNINLLIIPNISMKLRLDMMAETDWMYFIVIAGLILYIACMYMLLKMKFRKKDIL